MELRVKPNNTTHTEKPQPQVEEVSSNENDYDFVTTTQMQSMFNNFQHKLIPPNSLSPEVQGVVKAVQTVNGLKDALKDPTSVGLEESMKSLTTGLLDRALANAIGTQQVPQAPPKPLLHGLAEIATHNISGNLPQILEGLKAVLGTERIQQGYDAGLKYVEAKQGEDLVSIVMSLDENNNEHINFYAQKMGYTDFNKAKNALIEHKVVLYQEQQDYQNVQQGQNQQYADESQQNAQQLVPQEPQNIQQRQNQQYYEPQVESNNNIVMPPMIDVSDKVDAPIKIHVGKNKIKLKAVDADIVNDTITDDAIDEIFDEITT